LSITHFKPHQSLKSDGESHPELADKLRYWLQKALPDMLAAARASRLDARFDEEEVLKQWSLMEIVHHQNIWWELSLQDKGRCLSGTFGASEKGDVYFDESQRDKGQRSLLTFDGETLPLVQCAHPLAEALFKHRAFESLFQQVLVAWSEARDRPCNQEVPASVARLRRDLAISKDEVIYWREKVVAANLHATQKEQWRQQVQEALSQFGEICADKITFGIPITPTSWCAVTNENASESDVEKALQQCLEKVGDEAIVRLLPRVDFIEHNKQLLAQIIEQEEQSLLAERLARESDEKWEEWREEFRKRFRSPQLCEEQWLRRLSCSEKDLLQLLRARIGLDKNTTRPDEAMHKKALYYLQGKLLVSRLPEPSGATVNLTSWTVGLDPSPLSPLSPIAREEQARRKLEAGEQAENALLPFAVENALQWLQDNTEEFWRRLDELFQTEPQYDVSKKRILEAKQAENKREALSKFLFHHRTLF
jgi:hypothetical protein